MTAQGFDCLLCGELLDLHGRHFRARMILAQGG
jgi:hypothetical protein